MKIHIIALATISLIALSGCATITSEEMQPVSVTTELSNGEKILKASCTLCNDKGSWSVETPGFVSVHRSSEDLLVSCKKADIPDGNLRAISRASGGMFGNIILGGGIGAIIDHSKGTGYDYPNNLPVKMGQSIIVDKKDENIVDQSESNDIDVFE